ncbi:acyl-CoA N-acyltransferase [Aspergillus saccharolyticus JOP 1030-1]|uniref:Acyl-CoA N-acyltransferase n=1 Tax=Aspergillus saccharolyticus JOP 1030-1 TaxID=1450539 RepID=A0A318Z8R6_9EURO|nr:acyl-CoA N-acyltransferase [Aspergillus saccharolyticus JOP 1030-1]PYH43731.1 acyl-CoA N-acyltransferase [Aspergillus saccharolyticus JOP 1030-1]
MTPRYKIRPATESDAPHLAHINIVAFHHSPFWHNLFPNLDIAATTPLKLARTLAKLADAESHLLVAEEVSSGRVVGYARWIAPGIDAEDSPAEVSLQDPQNLNLVATWRAQQQQQDKTEKSAGQGEEDAPGILHGQEARAGAGGGMNPPGTNRAVQQRFWGQLERLKGLYVREGDFALELLATLPEEQGKGVASGLLRWGLERADRVNARVYLEATEEGYPIYRKYGWRDLEPFELDFAEYGGQGRQRWITMMRDRQKSKPVLDRQQ